MKRVCDFFEKKFKKLEIRVDGKNYRDYNPPNNDADNATLTQPTGSGQRVQRPTDPPIYRVVSRKGVVLGTKTYLEVVSGKHLPGADNFEETDLSVSVL